MKCTVPSMYPPRSCTIRSLLVVISYSVIKIYFEVAMSVISKFSKIIQDHQESSMVYL